MVVCRFFREGRCKFGDDCINEHPRGSSQNSFAPLSTSGHRPRAGATAAPQTDPNEAEIVKKDFTSERPQWPLSCYAPVPNAAQHIVQAKWDPSRPPTEPDQGAPEFSPEEMRYKFYLAAANNQRDAYVNWENGLMQALNEQVRSILNNIPGALRHCHDTAVPDKQNRLKQIVKPSGNLSAAPQRAGGFGSGTQANGAFGAPVRPGFGAASTLGPSKPAFGGPSALGGASTFGKPAALGGGAAFGQPGAGGAGTGFGAASSFGQSSSPFGSNQHRPVPAVTLTQPGSNGQTNQPFGGGPQKPSPFAQPAQPTGVFGGVSQQPAFGQTGLGGAPKPAFGQLTPAFGAASTPGLGQPSSGFGAASKPAFGQAAFGASAQQAPATGGFGTQQQQGTGFGQAGAMGANHPSPFTTPAQPASGSGFGQSSRPATSSPSPFAKPNPFASQPAQQTQQSPFAIPQASSSTTAQQSSAFPPTSKNAAIPAVWKGKPVVYPEKDVDRKRPCYKVPDQRFANTGGYRLERIWFPTGPPAGPQLTAGALPHVYEEAIIAAQLRAAYENVSRAGTFQGPIPEIPPKKEWISYDF